MLCGREAPDFECLELAETITQIDIDVGFDTDANVYFVLASDLPGLRIQMPTFEGFIEVAMDLAPDLMDDPSAGARLRFRRVVDLIPADGR